MKWLVLVLVVGCTSYRSGSAEIRAFSEADASAEGAGDDDAGEGDVVGLGRDAGDVGVDVDAGQALEEEEDAGAVIEEPVVDAGAEPEPDPEPEPVDPWWVGVFNIRARNLDCLHDQVWRVYVSDIGMQVDRDGDLGTFYMKRTAWGFEGQAPDGYYVTKFDEPTREVTGTLNPFGTSPIANCGHAYITGERVGDHVGGP